MTRRIQKRRESHQDRKHATHARPPKKWARVLPTSSADAAHCRYIDDSEPGISRVSRGKSFAYYFANKKRVTDEMTLARIKHLVIPPAWKNVWICVHAEGHIQATGRDARGRKQYRYHLRFRAIRDETKFERMLSFATALPKIRARVDGDMQQPGLSRKKVLATVVRLLEITLIRIGNESYARDNGSFGLTTMRTRHVDVDGSQIRFHFRGKSGVEHAVDVKDRRLAKIISRCNELPGEVLFQYVDDTGKRHSVESVDVNTYLKEVAGSDFTAKDFRTWAGTVLAAHALCELAIFDSHTAAKRHIVAAVKSVAARLGNTPAVCRKCYVHPDIFMAYLDGHLHDSLQSRLARTKAAKHATLSDEEAAVLALIRDRSALKAA